jgi:Protein of unknown function (DUF1552)
MSGLRGRRAFLRVLGLGAAAAPWVPLLPSHAETATPPRRMVFVHFAHGVARDRWSPVVGPAGLVLSPILAPLSAFADRLTVIEGLANAPGLAQVGDEHNLAVGTLLTAMPLLADLGPGGHYLPGGISIDQRLALDLGAGLDAPPWPSLQLGVRSQGVAISALYAERPVRAEDDPTAVYARLFGELALPPADRDYLQHERARARALVRSRLDALAPALPAADRDVLEAHGEAIDALEARLDALGPPPDECRVPEPSPAVDHPTAPADADVPALVRAQTELLVAALACDLTRVVTLQWGSSANDGLRHVWQGIDDEFHMLAHLANGEDPDAHEQLAAMNAWTMEQLAELLAALQAVPQADGTLLDHTVVVVCSGLSVGHSMADLPVVVAGGGVPGGRVLAAQGWPVAALWLALAEHLGVPLDGFGDPEYDFGVLPGVI